MLRVRLLAMGLKNDFKDLLGYGCWCNFLIKHDLRPKNMMPVDEIDEICRLWSKCHECSSIDRLNSNFWQRIKFSIQLLSM